MGKKHDRKRRFRGRNYHHLTNKCMGGGYSDSNLLLIKIERHQAWHVIFGNRSLEEVIEILQRIQRMKGRTYDSAKCA